MQISAKRNARVEVTASTSKFDAGLRDARKKLRSFGGDVRGAFGKVSGVAGKIAGGLGAGLGMAIPGGVADIVGDVLAAEKALTRFQIAGDRTPAQMEEFRASLSRVAGATGVARQELIDGAAAYVALTGDADGAAGSMEMFAKVANATGASVSDIAATAASMRDNMKIDPKDFEAAFSALHVQGKAGAVELRELAQVMSGVAPQFSKFDGGGGAAGLAELGATLQVLRKDFGTTSEAATGARALFGALVRGSAKLKKVGVEVFNPDGTKRNFTAIIDDILKADLGEPMLQKILGSDEALRSIGALRTHRGLLTEITAASKDQGAIERDAATFRQSSAGRLAASMEQLKASVADVFTPERIQAFAGAIETVVSGVSRLIGGLGSVVTKLGEAGKAIGGSSAFGSVVDTVSGGYFGRMRDEIAERRGMQATAIWSKEDQDRFEASRGKRDAIARSMGYASHEERWKAENAIAESRRKGTAAPAAAPAVNVNVVIDGAKVAAATAEATQRDARRGP